ncbi:unnamed protein product [Bursaphelenchus okinawaensis]|uniref:SCP domain-containing protein n=1 Tax=Bursaphelenchus okinawaensis TaxID=465554 RepID=A0A811K609_9BILA|nr:unnamed protein product [Bursaphelenchus okinawaensis]CAG9092068.1 unnamed protein product [Bursaphelenchus okinawaensis]
MKTFLFIACLATESYSLSSDEQTAAFNYHNVKKRIVALRQQAAADGQLPTAADMLAYDYETAVEAEEARLGQQLYLETQWVCWRTEHVIWANSYLVGCGITQCPTIANLGSDYDNGFIIVCNYQTAGSYINEPVYTAGDVRSQCPSDRVCDDRLCSLDATTQLLR